MKKLILSLSCLVLMGDIVAQNNWNFKNVPSSIKRKEGGSELFFAVRNSMPMNHSMWVTYSLTGKNSGANPNSDFNTFNFVDTVKFGNNDTVITLTFRAVLDGLIEGNDTFVLKLTNASMGTIVTPDSTTIIVEDSTAAPITGRQLYQIGAIRGANKDGIPDSINRSCSVRGTLYGINRRTLGTGYRMFICDGTGCMGMYSTKSYSILPTVNEGDSVEISGIIEEFNGLGQIQFNATGDTIRKLGFNSNLRKPKVVTALDENTESYLVKLDGLTLVSGSWFKDSAFDLKMKNSGGNEFSIRIENKPVSNFGAPDAIKSGVTYYITGIGSQFDNSSSKPFTKGYQLLPRKLSDISTTNSSISENSKNSEISVFPTLVKNTIHLYFESTTTEKASVQIIDLLGKIVKSENVQIVNGENLITLGQLETLNSGNYFIQLQSSSFQLNKQFSIVR
jgi:DNA/RNA endonuclease YhcR with UshA esterase domain